MSTATRAVAQRLPESCPHRGPADDAGSAACALALRTAGAPAGHPAGRVGLDACRACCAHPVPADGRLNPVVASAVGRLADAARGGAPWCDAERAEALRAWARRHLAVMAGDRPPSPPTRATRPCRHLGDPMGPAGIDPLDPGASRRCHHPARRVTTLDDCHRCRDWSDRPGPGPEPLARALPRRGRRRGPRVRRWAVGVTTAPRGLPTLDWTADSLVRAGWDQGQVHLFEDLPVTMAPRTARMPGTLRRECVGAWPNYYLGLSELLMREPGADAYLMAQDDVLFYEGEDLRAYLERVLWLDSPPGLVSLYCSAAYTRPEPGWHVLTRAWTWGALAFVFPRELAMRFVTDPQVFRHRWSGWNEGKANIDVVIGRWARRQGIAVHFPTPSLAQHIGDASTLWLTEPASGERRADRFLGDVESEASAR